MPTTTLVTRKLRLPAAHAADQRQPGKQPGQRDHRARLLGRRVAERQPHVCSPAGRSTVTSPSSPVG